MTPSSSTGSSPASSRAASSGGTGGAPLIGGHVDAADPVSQAQAIGADAVQIFLGDGQSWKGPVVEFDQAQVPGAGSPEAALRQAIEAADLRVYVHAPYVINVASPNNRIRIPSRKLLQLHVDAAAEIGAAGLIVHGGHVTKDDDPDIGFVNWRKAFDQLDAKVPVLIENTAGGQHAMARRLEAIDKLWAAIDNPEAGFCFDTCHAWAGGIDMPDAADQLMAITGRIDLVHANDSQGDFDSGRDRHANFGDGTIETDALVEAIRVAGAPVICETPSAGIAEDIALLKEALS